MRLNIHNIPGVKYSHDYVCGILVPFVTNQTNQAMYYAEMSDDSRIISLYCRSPHKRSDMLLSPICFLEFLPDLGDVPNGRRQITINSRLQSSSAIARRFIKEMELCA